MMDTQAFTEQLQREGFDEIVTRTSEVTQVHGVHSHRFEVKALVVQGQLTLGLGDKTFVYRAGDMFHLPLDCPHTEDVGPSGVTYIAGRKNATD